jgi:hypothetical protein
MANKVLGTDRSKTAVLGSAVFGANMRGMPPTPVLGLRRYLAKRGNVVLVNEFRTSKTCSNCQNEMPRGRVAWGVYQCITTGCYTTWARDRNASLNIAACFVGHHHGQGRPMALRRQPRQPPPAALPPVHALVAFVRACSLL